MDEAVFTQRVFKRLVQLTKTGYDLRPSPDIDGLPDWVQTAICDGRIFVSEDDSYTGVWITVPLGEEQGFAIRSASNDILVDHGSFIGVLMDPLGGEERESE